MKGKYSRLRINLLTWIEFPLRSFLVNLLPIVLLKANLFLPTPKTTNLNEQKIFQMYKMPFSATKDVQLSMFQVKIIHHILPTNATLHKFGIKEYDRCHLCAEKQTITHLFVTFPNAQLFWTQFTDWWYEQNNIAFTLSEAQILYGITDTVPQCFGLNLYIIIAKYYIYTPSKSEEDYFFDAFLSILKNKIQIETSKATGHPHKLCDRLCILNL